MATGRASILDLNNPDREKLVWESARGPVPVEEMSASWLSRAINVAEWTKSPALPAMRERLTRLMEEK